MTTATRPASDKQINLINRLMSEKDMPKALVVDLSVALDEGLGIRDASRFIDALFACPRKPKAAKPRVNVEEGFYVLADGGYAKVQKAVHGSGNLYAKRLIHGDVGNGNTASVSWEYEAGLINKMGDARKMTVEEACEFGKLYGVCMACGRTLTDETSIALGIGPVCRNKF